MMGPGWVTWAIEQSQGNTLPHESPSHSQRPPIDDSFFVAGTFPLVGHLGDRAKPMKPPLHESPSLDQRPPIEWRGSDGDAGWSLEVRWAIGTTRKSGGGWNWRAQL